MRRRTAAADEFEAALDSAADEAPLQRYLSKHAWILGGLGGFKHVFDKVRVGPRHVTDFATVVWGNYETWTLIELESPRTRLFTKAGVYSKQLNTAIRQVRDWTIWLRDFGELDGEEISPLHGQDVRAVIVIGRRKSLSRADRRRLIDINRTGPGDLLTIVTYDVLLDFAREQDEAALKVLTEKLVAARQLATVKAFRDR